MSYYLQEDIIKNRILIETCLATTILNNWKRFKVLSGRAFDANRSAHVYDIL